MPARWRRRPLARLPVDIRFLLHHVPSREMAESLLQQAPPGMTGELQAILKSRRFPSK